jgi:oxygen-dependent protoporphyrinogen oxidase
VVPDPEASRLLGEFRAVPQSLAILALDEPGLPERWPGFGFLVPRREGLPILGALFASQLFPNRSPRGTLVLAVFLGPSLREAPEVEIAQTVAPLVMRLLGAARAPLLVEVARHPLGIPLYDPGHPGRMSALRDRLDRSGGPLLAGSGYDGVAFGAAAASGVAAARRILDAGQKRVVTRPGAVPL